MSCSYYLWLLVGDIFTVISYQYDFIIVVAYNSIYDYLIKIMINKYFRGVKAHFSKILIPNIIGSGRRKTFLENDKAFYLVIPK